MNKTIYLVRHGKYHNPRGIFPGRLPVSLSAEGRKQAAALQRFFADKEIEKIYSSAVLRCRQTSEIISDEKIPIQFDKRILETFSAYQGYWGLEKNLLASWDEFYAHRQDLGGESYSDILGRVIPFFNDILAAPETNIIVCSHGDPLQLLYYHLSGHRIPDEMENDGEFTNPDYLQKGSYRLLRVEDGRYSFDPIVLQEDLPTAS